MSFVAIATYMMQHNQHLSTPTHHCIAMGFKVESHTLKRSILAKLSLKLSNMNINSLGTHFVRSQHPRKKKLRSRI